MLNTFHLRTFLAVVDNGSYSSAAAELHMSQPAVSQQIRALEEHLGGVRLFRRSGQKMVPTTAGEALIGNARELVALAERAEQRILALKGEVMGQVTVGCTANSGERLLPALLAIFRKHFPAVGLTIEVATSETLLAAASERQISLLLIEEPQRRRGWESQLLAAEPLVLLAPPGHPLLQQERIPPGVLREQTFLLPRAGSPLRRSIEEGLRKRGVPLIDLQIALETDSQTALLHGVRAGLGLAFVPQSFLPGKLDSVGAVDLAGQGLQQEWYVARLRDRDYPHAAAEFFNFLHGSHARTLLTTLGLRVTERVDE
jgi:DNA-binding transcriptional LysR family regulator